MDDSTSSRGGLSIHTKSSNDDDDDVSFSCSGDDLSVDDEQQDNRNVKDKTDDVTTEDNSKTAALSFLTSGNDKTVDDKEQPLRREIIHDDHANDFDSKWTPARQSDNNKDDMNNNNSDNYDDDDNDNDDSMNSSFSSCDNSEDETKWSLNVKLNSVVDLPTCILPSVPLCPLLKFGLVTITDEEQLQEIEQLSAAARRAEFEQSQDEKTKDLPQRSLRVTNGLLGDFQKVLSLVQCSMKSATTCESSSLSLSQSSNFSIVMSSSEKIMSKKDNGMIEWHEEMRWDEIKCPLQTVLAIELCARPVFPRNNSCVQGGGGYDGTDSTMNGSSHHRRSKTSLDVAIDANHNVKYVGVRVGDDEEENDKNNEIEIQQSGISNTQHSSSTKDEKGTDTTMVNVESGSHGILGLWRKGKQSLAERRNRRILSTPSSPAGSSHSITTPSKAKSETVGVASDTNGDGSGSNDTDGERLALARTLTTVIESNTDQDISNHVTNAGNQEVTFSASDDLRLGTLLIPISNLPLEDEIPRVETWYQFETLGNTSDKERFKTSPWRSPTVLLDISLCTSSTMNKLEEDIHAIPGSTTKVLGNGMKVINATHEDEEKEEITLMKNIHLSKSKDDDGQEQGIDSVQTIRKSRSNSKQKPFKKVSKGNISITEQDQDRGENDEKKNDEEKLKLHGPCLEPGIIDYICVVGPKDMGKPIDDTNARGWVNSEPNCCVLEQFPTNDYHRKNGRSCVLPEGIQWWCFPEGCKLWRGSEPPSHMDMNLKRFSASSPPRMASSIAAFDACLNCTSSFMWWVLSSNSDHYGSSITKTYGAVIRFYAEVPEISPDKSTISLKSNNKLWCPLGICLTSSLPIIGILEAILLRLCDKLSLAAAGNNVDRITSAIHSDVMNLILNYQKPIAGVINCSIPFLSGNGDRLHVSLSPTVGLPPLPHGASITSVCRLLGAEGLTALLAAVLTECKILMHSADVANLAMVGEVITALIYPFQWQLPFIPVLPLSMITFVEAPVSYFIGVPTCNMKYIQKNMLTDVFVIDLDNGLSSLDYFDGRLGLDISKAPSPLPASVSSNISKALFRLLREEEEIQDHFGLCAFSDNHHLTRLESESLAERDFRITIAHQLCGLIRGYQESLFYISSSNPVFNRDRFLREAPALFDERRPSVVGTTSEATAYKSIHNRIISPRSKRFLSGLVNTQHFHFLLETLESESNVFFHKIMETFEGEESECNSSLSFGSSKLKGVISRLKSYLETSEQKISTYHVHNRCLDQREEFESMSHFDSSYFPSFTSGILLPAYVRTSAHNTLPIDSETTPDKLLTSEYCNPNEPNEIVPRPWVYRELFNIDMISTSGDSVLWKKIHLREALGEIKFNNWKDEEDAKAHMEDLEEITVCDTISSITSMNTLLDLTKLISHVKNDELSNQILPSKLKQDSTVRINFLRRYIEGTYKQIESMKSGPENDKKISDDFDDIDAGVSTAMKDATAQRFLISILSQRSRLQNEYRHTDHGESPKQGNYIEGSTSNVHPLVFECLRHLCISMLDACQTDANFEYAYRLLVHTAGFRSMDKDMVTCDLTSLIAKHQIYSDLSLWDKVFLIHQQDRLKDRKGNESKTGNSSSKENDDYEATVSTLYEMLGYGMPADHLARFAHRIAREKFYFTEKEQKLLTLARRLAVKCDELLSNDEISKDDHVDRTNSDMQQSETYWEEIDWKHPCFCVNGYTNNFPITKLASIGSSIVATGALDGSLFLASTMHLEKEERGKIGRQFVRGEQLAWAENFHQGNPNTGIDGTVIPGSISCLGFTGISQISTERGISAIENCYLVAGTSNGYLGVWSVPNTLERVAFSDLTFDVGDRVANSEIWRHAGGHHSSHVRSNSSPTAHSKRNNKTKLGRVLGVHRSGVTCLSVPPQIYRPDSLISGGNDALIKLWSLREQSETSRSKVRSAGGTRNSRSFFHATTKSQENEAIDVLTGHGGRILCLETAWHGDRLLSGATDHTMKMWDLSNQSGGRCLQTMRGHTGWLTHCKYWGRNTIVSASSDRSIALWDARSGSRPLFILRHHNAPVSDLYLQSRTSNLLISAGSDGSIGTWDFRMMDTIGSANETVPSIPRSYVVRSPLSHMCHSVHNVGPTLLGRGLSLKNSRSEDSVMSANPDNVIKEWDTYSGRLLQEHNLRCGKMSCFKTFAAEENLTYKMKNDYGADTQMKLGGTITGTWDGAVKLRWLCINKQHGDV
mmetsp:Transcript_11585/g.21665  ORF Transcript_11585/g.21665 Transcript_11585/m.21665 type:complete len:2225 (+) Transcript_11585:70-6744(+)|eukprot:CAMPEP_0176489254 /NCGR_PEP_ID=MMETSP0200_2-20121128/7181_1 /TAXON_ID=947934 /ORGANISM="Chaetoceros sp., Strain GSL56" /LENGTH=2224 /DNA_ID=CAMNT_0017886365 /DNA_START=52 /DNA_END=6726 /DNA_ORIENTATION=+